MSVLTIITIITLGRKQYQDTNTANAELQEK